MATKRFSTRQHGFTLVELSIVLIIIGFIIAGVTAGASMVKSAGLRTIISELSTFQTAYQNFKGRYANMPGDYNKAFAIWGASCASTQAECDGNGNGKLESGWGDMTNTDGETSKFWLHLSLAGMYPLKGAAFGPITVGVNFPSSKYAPNVGYFPDQISDGRLLLFIGETSQPVDAYYWGNAVLTNSEIWSIDTKFDDGNARTGIFTAEPGQEEPSLAWNTTDCPNLTSSTGYKLDEPDKKACRGAMYLDRL